jgi:SNF2 family DNA or RNA helicase
MNWLPHPYQITARDFLINRNEAALFLDPGLGKTSIVLSALKAIGTPRTLIIAPLRVCYSVWPEEIKKWREFNDIRVCVIHGKDKAKAIKEDADIYLINPEGIDWALRHWELDDFDVLVVDELTKFKNISTRRFKLFKPLLPFFKRRWGLTGTPAPNGLMDLFGQVYMLDMGKTLGKYITKFRAEYFIQSFNGYDWVPRPNTNQELVEKLKPLALSMSASDNLQMPELIVNDIYITLPPSIMKIYKDLEKDLVATINTSTIDVANTAAAISKCMQIVNGGVYLEDGSWENIHNEKIDALDDLMEELGKPLLIAYNFVHDVERYNKYGGLRPIPYIGGGISANKAAELIGKWNNGELIALFGHPAAMGHGVNLQAGGHHICWFSLTWNLEYYDQFIRRIYRQGNVHSNVIVHRILAKGTIDEVVARTLNGKVKTQSAFFNALKNALLDKSN